MSDTLHNSKNSFNETAETTHPPEDIEKLNEEIIILQEEKVNLKNIEENLRLKIAKAIEERKQEKEKLEKEVEELRKRCQELIEVSNVVNQDN